MPNRILKESILDSPTLAKLDDFYQDQFPRLLLLVDDWGCFNADPEAVKGRAYPKRAKVTAKVIEKLLRAFYDAGMLFMWIEGDRTYGYWTGWDEHNYCNGSQVDETGKQVKHRRRTPEPPLELLTQYVATHQNGLGQVRTFSSIPIPIPIPIPPSGDSLSFTQEEPIRLGRYQHVLLKPDDLADLRTRLTGHFDELVTELDLYGENHPQKFAKYGNHAAVLETWYGRRLKERNGQPKRESAAEARQRRIEETNASLLAAANDPGGHIPS